MKTEKQTDTPSNEQDPNRNQVYKRYKIGDREVTFTKEEFEAVVEYYKALQAISMDGPAVIKAQNPCNNDENTSLKSVDSSKKVR